jgi:cation diffusion facilitator family transporter
VIRPDGHEMPAALEREHRRAVRLEWVTIVYLISVITVVYLTLGSSQAMKTVWAEDLLSLIPPAAFLFASRVRRRPPSDRFPYGHHRAVSIAFLCAALALLLMGGFLLFDSLLKLVTFEHPSIGTVELFGRKIWLGWLMIPALVWGIVPPVILGRMKLAIARTLHDKVLFADADMNRADWLTGVAGLLGVIGIALGWWWADAAAASVISWSILRDGAGNLRAVVQDLMDRTPMSVDHERVDPLPARLETELRSLPWVSDARVRLREEGRVFFGEAEVVPTDRRDLVPKLAEASERLRALDWRLHDLVIAPVERIEPWRGHDGKHQQNGPQG